MSDTGYADFLSRWHVAEFPFCPVGMRLLYALALNRPDLFEEARQGGFADFTDALFMYSIDVQALKRHVPLCEECQVC